MAAKENHLRIPIWISALLIAIGFVLFAFQANNYFRANLSLKWQTVRGTMLRSDWVKSGGRNSSSYAAFVEYRYVVNGQPHFSESLALWPCKGYSVAERLVQSHPAGSEVNVYYDPIQPDRAVLIQGGNIFGALAIGGAGCLLIGCWSLVDTLRLGLHRKNETKTELR